MTPSMAALAAAAAAFAIIVSGTVLRATVKKKKKRAHPLLSEAMELARFYDGRPLPATAMLEYDTLKEASKAAKADFPEGDQTEIKRAVWEAEYNEFIKSRFADEYRAMKKKLDNTKRKTRQAALGLLNETKENLPSGVQATIRGYDKKGMIVFDRTFLYKLPDAHLWLDTVSPLPGGVTHQEQFQAIKAYRFRCAKCGKDWDDGIALRTVKMKSGTLAPICTNCTKEKQST